MSALRRYEAWWLDATASREKLALFRVAFFSIVGIDAFLQIAHAPRYGIGGFNVANLPLIASILPEAGRAGMLAVWLLQAYLALRIALGGATRSAVVALCVLFGYGYFISQLDSYQHHYLVFLVLVLSCFVRWDRGEKLTSAWPIRAILVTISVVYVFAAISKLEASWIDGHTLFFQVKKPWLHDLITRLGDIRVVSGELVDAGGYGAAAAIIVMIELSLALAIHIPRLRLVAVIVGVGFHIGVELSGFKIGLFSYFMCAIYLLVLPDKWFAHARPAIERVTHALGTVRKKLTPSWSLTWAIAIACFVAGGVALGLLPFTGMTVPVVLASALGVLGVLEHRRGAGKGKHRAVAGIAAAHLAACLVIAALNVTTVSARDYHRYWAASLRQMGNLEKAIPIYERAVALDTDYAPGHNSLANLYRRTGRYQEALDHYATAQRFEPNNWRPYVGEAMAHDALGNGDRALASAIKALALNPGNAEAQQVRDKWAGSR